MSLIFFTIGAACGWQMGNSLRRLVSGVALRWIDWAAAEVLILAVTVVALL